MSMENVVELANVEEAICCKLNITTGEKIFTAQKGKLVLRGYIIWYHALRKSGKNIENA